MSHGTLMPKQPKRPRDPAQLATPPDPHLTRRNPAATPPTGRISPFPHCHPAMCSRENGTIAAPASRDARFFEHRPPPLAVRRREARRRDGPAPEARGQLLKEVEKAKGGRLTKKPSWRATVFQRHQRSPESPHDGRRVLGSASSRAAWSKPRSLAAR
jgi:hypothetical protein